MEIKDLQQQIDLNSANITNLEEILVFAQSYNSPILKSHTRKQISRLSKLQKILKKEIARLIAEQREEKAYEMAAEGIGSASRFRRFGDL